MYLVKNEDLEEVTITKYGDNLNCCTNCRLFCEKCKEYYHESMQYRHEDCAIFSDSKGSSDNEQDGEN